MNVKDNQEAKYVHHWLKPEVVRVQWGAKTYDYYLDGIPNLNTFLWLKNRAGMNKAANWLKKNAYKYESVEA